MQSIHSLKDNYEQATAHTHRYYSIRRLVDVPYLDHLFQLESTNCFDSAWDTGWHMPCRREKACPLSIPIGPIIVHYGAVVDSTLHLLHHSWVQTRCGVSVVCGPYSNNRFTLCINWHFNCGHNTLQYTVYSVCSLASLSLSLNSGFQFQKLVCPLVH